MLSTVKLVIWASLVTMAFGSKCVLYGICDGNYGIPCAADSGPRKIDTSKLDEYYVKSFNKLCPQFNLNDDLCCDHDQVKFMVIALNSKIRETFSACPTCLANIASVYCAMTCSPKQSEFLSAGKLSSDKEEVNEVAADVMQSYANSLYESCRYVRHPDSESRKAVEKICYDCEDGLEFFKRLVRDFPFPGATTARLWLTSESNSSPLNQAVIGCNGKASGFESTCGCEDCPLSCSKIKPTKEPISEVTSEITAKTIVPDSNGGSRGAGSMIHQSMGYLIASLIFVTIINIAQLINYEC